MENLKKNEMDRFVVARRRMVEEQLIGRKIRDPRVLEAMGNLPRHEFVPDALVDQAYGDYPVGIGQGQTISQPYIVALMTELMDLKGSERVLEIGTGCGYQTALLARLAGQIFTIERIKELGFKARASLKQLGLKNIVMRIGDGSHGWPEKAPFDRILVAAGSPEIPMPLFQQLAEGGKLVVPVGPEDKQELLLISKTDGQMKTQNLGPCRFVRLVGSFGWGKAPQAGAQFKKRSLV